MPSPRVPTGVGSGLAARGNCSPPPLCKTYRRRPRGGIEWLVDFQTVTLGNRPVVFSWKNPLLLCEF